MYLINDLQTLKYFISGQKKQGKTIGLVPTMGYLHAGHLSLIKTAKESSDIVIVSIFVNPLQFSPDEDLASYPRDIEGDNALCYKAKVDAVFTPHSSQLYPEHKPYTSIIISELDRNLCGASRPGHFNGVCIIIAKLFNLILPDMAFFGQKDIQQLRIIETLTRDLNFPVRIIGCDTVRDKTGLALSSRNSYLSASEMEAAVIVPNLLSFICQQIRQGQKDVSTLLKNSYNFLANCSIARLDYLQIVDYANLQLLEKIDGKAIIATAIYIGKTRLIDNTIYIPE